MASATKPTVLLLQGTFQNPDIYYKFAQLIESRGFPVVQPSFPSLTDHHDPDFTKKTLDDDIQVVETTIRKLVEHEGKRVLVFMHSYGGLVGAEAIPDDLTFASRNERDLPGGVAYLFYLAGFVLQSGHTYVPSTYVVCNGDTAVPPQVQELFAKQSGAKIKRIEAGHSAFLSKPEEVLALFEEAADVIS
ncbi:hypothetical protein SLS53_005326 [Cytospora paraplurivora]|uniref:AB hydrolase-1 domain-containing protein n=1 Tax=Cytospora paraplurivora TaxID=2898453 RepID=A0AAN9YEI7_9PEZI